MTSLNLPDAALAAALTFLPLLWPEPAPTLIPAGNYRLGEGGTVISIDLWMKIEGDLMLLRLMMEADQ